MLFLYYPKCSTCQKAKKWLDANHISYEERHIVEENPTYEELKQWYENGDLPLKKFFNTSHSHSSGGAVLQERAAIEF